MPLSGTWCAAGLVAAVVAGSCGGASGPSPSASNAPRAPFLPAGVEVRLYADDLDFPVDLAWVPGTKKIFFTEKNSGQIRVLTAGELKAAPCADLDVEADGERGALGIALHPRWDDNHFLYVYYTNASPLEHRVTRFKVEGGRCTAPVHVVTGIDASSSGYHNGGQLEFMGGKLFVSTGEAHDPAAAQSTSNRLGKILRYNPDGSIPRGNPFSTASRRNPVWSYGHRNPFGLARRPGTSALYASENGPQCDDELNRIVPGGNYGWGAGYSCAGDGVGDNPRAPLMRWTPPIVPTDPWWYQGRLKALSGSLYMGDFGAGALHRFVFNDLGTRVERHRVIYEATAGIVDVTKGPGGWLYFATPGAIYRLVAS